MWIDLTVPDAESLERFYAGVLGCKTMPIAMEGYDDYCVIGEDGGPLAGVCHARGPNADLPPVWMVYFPVTDLDQAVARCTAEGGAILAGPKSMDEEHRYAVIRDPTGAVCALMEGSGS